MRAPVAATVHEAKRCAQRNRCLEGTGVPRLNTQSPSKLGWRLRVEVRMICSFGSMLDNPQHLASWIRQPPDRYREACPTS